MKVMLLLTPEMEPIPEPIKTVHDGDEIEIITNQDSFDPKFVRGKHVVLEGTAEQFKAWFRQFKEGVWVGHGAAQLQQFTRQRVE